MMVIECRFDVEQIVYLKSDPEQCARMVTGVIVRPGGNLIYYLSCGTIESTHYECEISEEADIMQKTK